MCIALLGLRLADISDTVGKHLGEIIGKESSNTIHHLSVNDRDVTSHRDIATTFLLFARKLKSRI